MIMTDEPRPAPPPIDLASAIAALNDHLARGGRLTMTTRTVVRRFDSGSVISRDDEVEIVRLEMKGSPH
jgi:hypothetical protein